MLYIDDHIDELDLSAALPLLSEQRREQVLRYRYEQGRRLSAAAYLLLCKGLRTEYGISEPPVFCYGEHGKPSIMGHPDIFFSLSHCRQAALCALSDRPVGADVESVREYRASLVSYTMNDDETAAILHAPRPEVAFTRLWTMKEARLKLTGEGITNHLQDTLSDSHSFRFTTVERLERDYIYTVCEPLTD